MFKLNYPKFWQKIGIIPIILYPFSKIFHLLGLLRKLFKKEQHLGYPSICVGNISVGGTGKTFLIKQLGRYFLEKKKKLVVISKGFKGSYVKPTIIEPSSNVSLSGDEALEIVRYLYPIGDVEVIVARNPIDAKPYLDLIKPDIILIDDGMQNPSFTKDYQIIMVDGMRGFGNGFLIPSGPLREYPKYAIERADLVVSVNPETEIENYFARSVKYLSLNAISVLDGILPEDPIFLFCSIGNPERFMKTISGSYNIKGYKFFPDHYQYNISDLEFIELEAKKIGAKFLVSTYKDATKLENLRSSIPIIYADLVAEDNIIENIAEKINEKINVKNR